MVQRKECLTPIAVAELFSNPVSCGLSLLLVLVLVLRVFLLVLQFSSPHRNQHSKFYFNLEKVDKKSHLMECSLLKFSPFPIKPRKIADIKESDIAPLVFFY